MPPVPATAFVPLMGHYLTWMEERPGQRLSLDKARALYQQGHFQPLVEDVLNLGVGRGPVWLAFRVNNPRQHAEPRRLLIRNSWLDRVTVYLQLAGGGTARLEFGDLFPREARPIPGRYFGFDQDWPPGTSLVFMRVETPEPMILPMALGSVDDINVILLDEAYIQGALYGLLLGLLAFNLVLYLRLRMTVYLAYVFFVASFLIVHMAHTGNLWPSVLSPVAGQWLNLVSITLFGVGLMQFALAFLNVRQYNRQAWRMAQIVTVVLSVVIFTLALLGARGAAISAAIVSFIILSGYALFLGGQAMLMGQSEGRYFVLASGASLSGGAVTAATVMGWLPFTNFTIHLVEVGVAFEAVLLSFALGAMLREARTAREAAEYMASTDLLTCIANRRGFLNNVHKIMCRPEKGGAYREDSCMIIDIDYFKRINDSHGHSAGDEVLKRVAQCIAGIIRQEDVLGRWGGEEFALYLPNTGRAAASRLARRIWQEVDQLRIGIRERSSDRSNSVKISPSVSIGHVTHKFPPGKISIEELIQAADAAMYRAKAQGRNRVVAGCLASPG